MLFRKKKAQQARRSRAPSIYQAAVVSRAKAQEIEWKILVIGDPSIGKCDFILKYVCESPEEETNSKNSELNAELYAQWKKRAVVDGRTFRLQIHDTPSLDHFSQGSDDVLEADIREADGFLLLYDVSSTKSYTEANRSRGYITRTRGTAGTPFAMIFVGQISSGSEDDPLRIVRWDDGKESALSFECPFMEVAIHDRAQIRNAFAELVREIGRFKAADESTGSDDSRTEKLNTPAIREAKAARFRYTRVDTADIKFEQTGPRDKQPKIIAASLPRIIERITYEKYPYQELTKTFLLTYRAFTTPKTLLDMLIKRYMISPPRDLSPWATHPTDDSSEDSAQPQQATSPLAQWQKKVQTPVRLRVYNVLKCWIKGHYAEDFSKDRLVISTLIQFIDGPMRQNTLTCAKQLSSILESQARKSSTDSTLSSQQHSADTTLLAPSDEPVQSPPVKEPMFSSAKPKPMISRKVSGGKFQFLDLNVLEVARQLTLLDHSIYKLITPGELIMWNKLKKDAKDRDAPNVSAMIKRFNELSLFVQYEIIGQAKTKQRTLAITRWIQVAASCLDHVNNFHSFMAIMSALEECAIYRLKKSWSGVHRKTLDRFSEIKQLVNARGAFTKLREAMTKATPPLIPHLGVFLTDLAYIEDGNRDFVDMDLINLDKCDKMASAIKLLQQWQDAPYCLEKVEAVSAYLRTPVPLSTEQLYKLSCDVEPSAIASSRGPGLTVTAHGEEKFSSTRVSKPHRGGSHPVHAKVQVSAPILHGKNHRPVVPPANWKQGSGKGRLHNEEASSTAFSLTRTQQEGNAGEPAPTTISVPLAKRKESPPGPMIPRLSPPAASASPPATWSQPLHAETPTPPRALPIGVPATRAHSPGGVQSSPTSTPSQPIPTPSQPTSTPSSAPILTMVVSSSPPRSPTIVSSPFSYTLPTAPHSPSETPPPRPQSWRRWATPAAARDPIAYAQLVQGLERAATFAVGGGSQILQLLQVWQDEFAKQEETSWSVLPLQHNTLKRALLQSCALEIIVKGLLQHFPDDPDAIILRFFDAVLIGSTVEKEEIYRYVISLATAPRPQGPASQLPLPETVVKIVAQLFGSILKIRPLDMALLEQLTEENKKAAQLLAEILEKDEQEGGHSVKDNAEKINLSMEMVRLGDAAPKLIRALRSADAEGTRECAHPGDDALYAHAREVAHALQSSSGQGEGGDFSQLGRRLEEFVDWIQLTASAIAQADEEILKMSLLSTARDHLDVIELNLDIILEQQVLLQRRLSKLSELRKASNLDALMLKKIDATWTQDLNSMRELMVHTEAAEASVGRFVVYYATLCMEVKSEEERALQSEKGNLPFAGEEIPKEVVDVLHVFLQIRKLQKAVEEAVPELRGVEESGAEEEEQSVEEEKGQSEGEEVENETQVEEEDRERSKSLQEGEQGAENAAEVVVVTSARWSAESGLERSLAPTKPLPVVVGRGTGRGVRMGRKIAPVRPIGRGVH